MSNESKNMPIDFLSLDIDNTLINEQSLDGKFDEYWQRAPRENRPILCYNTGRLLDDTLDLVKNNVLPRPDYIISGVGTNIYDANERRVIKEFSEILEEGWDTERVQQIVNQMPFHLEKQPTHFQHDYKQSYFFVDASPKDVDYIEQVFKETDLEVNIVYSSNKFLDVLPKWANKGNALNWLLRQLDIPTQHVLVAGDSGNDNTMFSLPGVRGIVVGNAQQELYEFTKRMDVYHAEKNFSEGLIEGLKFYKVLAESKSAEEIVASKEHGAQEEVRSELIDHLDEEDMGAISREDIEFIRQGYEKAIEAVKYNITPLGFSACSLEHNYSLGTDTNYRSVWARDGAITIIGTIPLTKKDEEIHNCQIATFDTLLSHVSPSGQVPSNVSIDDNTPDYSGVGGICSIDSGMWLIIAFYEYIKTTRKLDYLRENLNTLQCVMDWLSAHDGNNDALLEIPEAGDWTDLLGRSYNILYDEVLWYRTNICFGRLLEMIGKEEQAGDYIRWSQVIKKEIQLNFWPSTSQKMFESISFAESQYSLGDARYLIAQVTPFDFSWRCDVYGNILAFLYDVIDLEKAEHACRFMWGIGASDPYPVRNLYPAIMPGDPDWRSYYTVNLLNLPHHYHNGGIWPFVGATWVRFLQKVGLEDTALKELCKLAHLNKLGMRYEWEFNEWAHGKTGRPMGKMFQAWSAAQFILSCHRLKIVNNKNT
jgi:sucrose-6F-phosphate phosphohydrolase